jgi:hypothetical protein
MPWSDTHSRVQRHAAAARLALDTARAPSPAGFEVAQIDGFTTGALPDRGCRAIQDGWHRLLEWLAEHLGVNPRYLGVPGLRADSRRGAMAVSAVASSGRLRVDAPRVAQPCGAVTATRCERGSAVDRAAGLLRPLAMIALPYNSTSSDAARARGDGAVLVERARTARASVVVWYESADAEDYLASADLDDPICVFDRHPSTERPSSSRRPAGGTSRTHRCT